MNILIKKETKINHILGIIAIISAFALCVADFLLEFNPEYGISVSSIVEPSWIEMSNWRFSLSLNLCAFFIPFYICGYFLVYKVIKKTNKKIATIILILFSYGTIMGSPLIHGVMCNFPIIYNYGLVNNIDINFLNNLIANELTSSILIVFIFHYLITWIISPSILFFYIISGKSKLKRWNAILNPLVFLIICLLGLKVFP
ncbi:MAG: DUF6796 family protein, partial [Pleomorphochaeta sp.]